MFVKEGRLSCHKGEGDKSSLSEGNAHESLSLFKDLEQWKSTDETPALLLLSQHKEIVLQRDSKSWLLNIITIASKDKQLYVNT